MEGRRKSNTPAHFLLPGIKREKKHMKQPSDTHVPLMEEENLPDITHAKDKPKIKLAEESEEVSGARRNRLSKRSNSYNLNL